MLLGGSGSFLPVLANSRWLWNDLDGSGLMGQILASFDSYGQFSMVLGICRWLWPVQHGCGRYRMIVDGFVRLWMVLTGYEWFLPVLYSSGFSGQLWMGLAGSKLVWVVLDRSKWFLPVLDSYGRFWMVMAS